MNKSKKVLPVEEYDSFVELVDQRETLTTVSAGKLIKLSEDRSLTGKHLLYSKEAIEINIFSIVNSRENTKLYISKVNRKNI